MKVKCVCLINDNQTNGPTGSTTKGNITDDMNKFIENKGLKEIGKEN